MVSQMSHEIDHGLRQLGIKGHWLHRVGEIRAKFDRIAQRGIPGMPDFTLHNVTHSDNLIILLVELHEKCGFTLNEYESYLLAAACYLHDLGMFFSQARFEQNILPDLARTLRFCPRNCCDHIGNYDLAGKSVPKQIRLTHNLLSAYWLGKEPTTFGLERDDAHYVLTLCRGHRVANLRATGCNCYQTKRHHGQDVRVGLLASLLRLVDALDFFADRAPASAFQHGALDFLRDPIALEHWIKHYFVGDPYITVQDHQRNQVLECQLCVAVPMKEVNDQSYLDFFQPLFEEHIRSALVSDLNRDEYPPILMQTLGIDDLVITLVPEQRAGAPDLPPEIISRIEASACEEILGFLDWLKHPPQREGEPPVLNREEEKQAFREMISCQCPQRLMLISGDRGQGKSYLLRELQQTAAGEGLQSLSFDFKEMALDHREILERLRKALSDIPFPSYETCRDRLSCLAEAPSAAERTARRRELTTEFLSDWGRTLDAPRIVLVFDSYEHAGREVRIWLEQEFLAEFADVSESVMVVSGREVPDKSQWEWAIHFHLEGLKSSRYWREFTQFLGSYIPDETLDAFHNAFEGRPLEMVKAIRVLAYARLQ
jgi:hypothetical protein